MFKKRFTQWIPLGNFTHGSYGYVTFVRKNIKTGMLYFKTKRTNGWYGVMRCTNPFMPHNLIDVKSAWEKIVKS